METLLDVLQRISNRELTTDVENHLLDDHTNGARCWIEALKAESQEQLEWPARLVNEYQIQVQDMRTGRWILLFV
jgi:hypothetical protein